MTRTSTTPSAFARLARAAGLGLVLVVALYAAAPRAMATELAAELVAACTVETGHAAASCPHATSQPAATAVIGQGWG
jgi:hypothetical protein